MKNDWYALYVKPRAEKKVSTLLEQKDIENYVPVKKNTAAMERPEKMG